MDDTLDCWDRLAIRILKFAIKEARDGKTIRLRLEARMYLFEPESEWLLRLLDANVQRVRDALLTVWTHQAF